MKTLSAIMVTLMVLTGCSGNAAPNKTIPSEIEKQTYTNVQDSMSKDRMIISEAPIISYAIDVKNPQVLLEDGTQAVVKIKIGNIKAARLNGDQVETPMEVVSYEVLGGTINRPLHEISVSGGIINLESYIQTLNELQIKKMELHDLSEEEVSNQYVNVLSDTSFDYVPGATYVVLVVENNGTYAIQMDGFGTFVENDSNGTYKNVLSGVTSDLVFE